MKSVKYSMMAWPFVYIGGYILAILSSIISDSMVYISLGIFCILTIALSTTYYCLNILPEGPKEVYHTAYQNLQIKKVNAICDAILYTLTITLWIQGLLDAQNGHMGIGLAQLFLLLFIVPYTLVRLIMLIFTMAVGKEALNGAHKRGWITAHYCNLHTILHLVPVVALFSAVSVERRLRQELHKHSNT